MDEERKKKPTHIHKQKGKKKRFFFKGLRGKEVKEEKDEVKKGGRKSFASNYIFHLFCAGVLIYRQTYNKDVIANCHKKTFSSRLWKS